MTKKKPAMMSDEARLGLAKKMAQIEKATTATQERSAKRRMSDNAFWELIERSRQGLRKRKADRNPELQVRNLEKALSALDPKDVAGFAEKFHQKCMRANTYELWGVATLLAGGMCSDDAFCYFRYWLISMGKEVFKGAVRNPDSLVAAVDDATVVSFFFEAFGPIPGMVYEEVTGEELSLELEADVETRGRPWSDSAELNRAYPRVSAAMQMETVER